ncbi:hypothetical protein ONS95_002713 [Cadophora gregata]|uniref:uncharacterized protein n=1 Tax=Cadophora gregata TaxID=51156 RepID=UPI0026DCA731|nr:uncharacterized protein ONS95_002713 [Cadophora gregata]KAK0110053.1 hypothetical protein ONS95_002713 [Cadophora gregata]
MCRTFTITYMLCLHIRIDHQPCRHSRSFLALFLSACTDDVSQININDFCLECRKFWDEEAISETARRELAQAFRIVNAYHGELTPMKDGIGVITFREQGEMGEQVSDRKNMPSGHEMDDDVTAVCMLNAQFHWLAAGDEPVKQHKGNPEQNLESLPPLPQSRRGSDASTLTIWPSKLDEMPIFEIDEFGNELEVQHMTAPPAAHLVGRRYTYMDQMEMKNLEAQLPGAVDKNGFETQRVLRPAASIANNLPHRGSSELAKPDRSFAEPSRLSANF